MTDHGPIYPDVSVRLVGTDGNALAIVSKVAAALRRAGVPTDRVRDFKTEALASDYNHVLGTCMRWVDVS